MTLIGGLLFAVGFVLLVLGADMLVRGASSMAVGFGVSRLVVGLTVVAIGTSAPEFAVTLQAAAEGGVHANLALGNVVGSNIFNILVVLGISAALAPLVIDSRLIRIEVPVMVVAALAAYLMALDGSLTRPEGLLLFAGLLAYIGFTVYEAARLRRAARQPGARASLPSARSVARDLAMIGAGLLMLVAGAHWVVDGAIELARLVGISEVVIGLTIVAAGTSLPEVAASAVAALRGRGDIALGNVIGSCMFNSLGVLGLSGLLAPGGVAAPAAVVAFDAPVMLAVSVVCLPIFFTGFRVSRGEGLLFLGYYAAYVIFLVMDAAHHDRIGLYVDIMLYVVVPVTVLTLAGGVWQQVRSSARADGNA